jgi:hypothetical protein
VRAVHGKLHETSIQRAAGNMAGERLILEEPASSQATSGPHRTQRRPGLATGNDTRGCLGVASWIIYGCQKLMQEGRAVCSRSSVRPHQRLVWPRAYAHVAMNTRLRTIQIAGDDDVERPRHYRRGSSETSSTRSFRYPRLNRRGRPSRFEITMTTPMRVARDPRGSRARWRTRSSDWR